MKGEKRMQIKKICAELGIEIQVVSPAEYGEPVGALMDLPGMRKLGRPCTGSGVTGEMLVFAGLDSDDLDAFFDACKRDGVASVACKAVLTPHNAAWSGEKLYEELQREHQSVAEKYL